MTTKPKNGLEEGLVRLDHNTIIIQEVTAGMVEIFLQILLVQC